MFEFNIPYNILGVNHHTLELKEREKLASSLKQIGISDFIQRLKDKCGDTEIALLSTCNRFELVFTNSSYADHLKAAVNHEIFGGSKTDFWFHKQGAEAIQHFLRVASSLDSMVLGEAQILGQVKQAYLTAKNVNSVGPLLHRLFQYSFHIAKRIKSVTTIADSAVSLSYLAVQLSKQIVSDLVNAQVLVIGSGEMAELCLLHLKNSGVTNIIIANRTKEKAVELAKKFGGRAITLEDLSKNLAQTDIVIGSISVDRPLLLQSYFKDARRKPLFLIDLGVPRNFSPALGDLDDLYLYNLDDLGKIVLENQSLREDAAKDAFVLIEYGVHQFLRWLRKIDSQPELIDFRKMVQRICDRELRSLLKSKDVANAAMMDEQISSFSEQMSNKLIHAVGEMLTSDVLKVLKEQTVKNPSAVDLPQLDGFEGWDNLLE